ncbi:hypothetical protein [Kibdelosporangium philippinense]|uniref:hypothetical protein n=1 Tax=Kibdelosporangium philippinense TaxID=211113 RepID=UPI0036236A89
MVDTRQLAGKERNPRARCGKVHLTVSQRWTRCAGTVDTVCWNGGHGVLHACHPRDSVLG